MTNKEKCIELFNELGLPFSVLNVIENRICLISYNSVKQDKVITDKDIKWLTFEFDANGKFTGIEID